MALVKFENLCFADQFYPPTPQFGVWLDGARQAIRAEAVEAGKRLLSRKVHCGSFEDASLIGTWLEQLGGHDDGSRELYREAALGAGLPRSGKQDRGDTGELDGAGATTGMGAGQFVGREKEFAVASAAFDRASRGAKELILLSGDPGIGKTRLSERFARYAAVKGARVIQVTCYETERSLPYEAIARLLNTMRREQVKPLEPPWERALAAIFPDVASEQPHDAASGLGAQRRLFEAASRLVTNWIGHRLGAIIIDDFQWLDESSCTALEYLLRRLEDVGLVVLVAYRPQEVLASPATDRFIRAAQNGPSTRMISLLPLSEAEIAAWLSSIHAGRDESELRTIAARAKGNPFFSRELSLVDDPAVQIPATIGDAVLGRLAGLNAQARTIVETLAVAGAPIAPLLLSKITKVEQPSLPETLEHLEHSGWTEVREGLCLTHDLVREAVYYGMSKSKRILLHQALANESSDLPAAFVAHHAQQGGLRVLAREFALKAANDCKSSHGYKDEVRWLKVALEHSRGGGKQEVAIALLRKLIELGLIAEGSEVVRQLGDKRSGALEARARLVQLKARKILGEESLLPEVRAFMDHCKKKQRHWEYIQAASLAFAVAHHQGDREAITGILADLRQYADDCTDAKDAAEAVRRVVMYGVYYRLAGDVRADLKRSWVAASKSGDQLFLNSLRLDRGILNYYKGRLEHAERDWNKSLAIARTLGSIDQTLRSNLFLAVILTDRARFSDAQGCARKALKLAAYGDDPQQELFSRLNLAISLYESGVYDEAREEATRALERESSHPVWFLNVAAHSLLGLLALQNGNRAIAQRHREIITAKLPPTGRWIDDLSYVALFLARSHMLEREVDAAISILRSAEMNYRGWLYPSASRIRIERVITQLRSGDPQAPGRLRRIQRTAARRGLTLHAIRAEEALGYN